MSRRHFTKEEWSDTECVRISAGFNKVMKMYVAKQFLVPVNLEQYPNYTSIVKYPMDLSTIQARLESRFYRRVSAVEYDVRHIYINAFKYNLPTSDIVRNSSVVSELCLEIIRNRDSSDVKALYQQGLEKYRIQDEKEEKADKDNTLDEPKPKKSKPTTLAPTSDPCWKQQCKDPLEILKQSEDAVLFIELANNITGHTNKEQCANNDVTMETMSVNSVSIRMAEASSTLSTGHQENQMVLNGQHANHLKAQPPLKMLDPLEVYAQTAVVEASSSTQLAYADEQISVCNASVIDGADGVNEQSDIDIENGYRILEKMKADIQKDIHLLSEQHEQINANCSTLFEKFNKFN